jgi:hypothetical protein
MNIPNKLLAGHIQPTMVGNLLSFPFNFDYKKVNRRLIDR